MVSDLHYRATRGPVDLQQSSSRFTIGIPQLRSRGGLLGAPFEVYSCPGVHALVRNCRAGDDCPWLAAFGQCACEH